MTPLLKTSRWLPLLVALCCLAAFPSCHRSVGENCCFADEAIQLYRQARYDGRPTGDPFRDSYYALRHALDSIPFVCDTDEPYAYHVVGSDDCTSILAKLPGVQMEQGWQMCVQYKGDINGNCYLMARRGDSVTNLLDHLEVDFTEEGVWNAMMLDMSYGYLPCGWHGCYLKMSIIFDIEEILRAPDIQHASKTDPLGELREKLSKETVEINNRVRILDADHAVIEAYCWHDWHGLYINRIQVTRHGDNVTFQPSPIKDCQILIPYDSTVQF